MASEYSNPLIRWDCSQKFLFKNFNRDVQPGLHESEHEQPVEGARHGLRAQEEPRWPQEVPQDVPGSAGALFNRKNYSLRFC